MFLRVSLGINPQAKSTTDYADKRMEYNGLRGWSTTDYADKRMEYNGLRG